jgi:hypothetical protein
MERYCIALELIAFAIHPGNTQSTTTICLDVKSACLYLTSQNNFSFETATRQGVHDVIDELVKASIELQKGTKLEALKKYFWEKCCALYTKPPASKKAEEEIGRIYTKGAYHDLWEQFQKADYAASELEKLHFTFTSLGVIKDEDIFYSKAPEKSGFHGESRLIRFLFIRDYPAIHLAKTGTFFYLLPGQMVSQKIKSNARTWFKDHISTQQLAMGSSQGTCEGCADCLNEFKIAHGKVGNPPKQWLDPLTMSGYQGSTPLAKGERHHAIFVAYRSIICGHQEEDEDETGKMEKT